MEDPGDVSWMLDVRKQRVLHSVSPASSLTNRKVLTEKKPHSQLSLQELCSYTCEFICSSELSWEEKQRLHLVTLPQTPSTQGSLLAMLFESLTFPG